MTASVFKPQASEQSQLQALAEQLEQGASVAVTLPGQPATPASPVVLEILKACLKEFSEGNGVTLLSHRHELSTHEAAEILGISRPHLINNLLDGGLLPYRKVGTHRRIALTDLQKYQAERQRQHALLDEIVADEQAAGLY